MQTDICTQEVKCSQGRENVFPVLCFCSAGLHVKGQMREACVCVYACMCVERGHGGCSSMPLWGVLGTDGQTVLKSMNLGLSTWPAGASSLTPHSPFCLSQIHLYNTLRSNVLPIHLNTENAILGYNLNFCTLLYIHHLL